MKRLLPVFLCVILCVQSYLMQSISVSAVGDEANVQENQQSQEATENMENKTPHIEISAPSALLMEASTGQVVFEKDADSKRPPASVTKIMTLLLIFDALEAGKIKLEDEVTTSEFAASMGGSQVFLEPGEVQTVDTLIKCIAVASANDGCVAMAEYICGSETEFVSRMNERAKGLGMSNTTFKNCNGLDAEGHVTTARDIALMSRELITKYPKIRDYCMIWQENITHTTRKGTSEFGLTNTNKLVRHYEYATGLKTGSTSQAKFCISATAEKDGMEMIAVIMAADDSKLRNKDAITLLGYGFGACNRFQEENVPKVNPVKISGGVEKEVHAEQSVPFSYVDTTGADLNAIERKVVLDEKITAPVKKGQKIGEVKYYLDGKEVGSVDVVTSEAVKKATYGSTLKDILEEFFSMI